MINILKLHTLGKRYSIADSALRTSINFKENKRSGHEMLGLRNFTRNNIHDFWYTKSNFEGAFKNIYYISIIPAHTTIFVKYLRSVNYRRLISFLYV